MDLSKTIFVLYFQKPSTQVQFFFLSAYLIFYCHEIRAEATISHSLIDLTDNIVQEKSWHLAFVGEMIQVVRDHNFEIFLCWT